MAADDLGCVISIQSQASPEVREGSFSSCACVGVLIGQLTPLITTIQQVNAIRSTASSHGGIRSVLAVNHGEADAL